MRSGVTLSLLRRSGPPLVAALVAIAGVGAALLITSPQRGDPIQLAEPANLRIHVAGEVLSPGLYELPFGSIVKDAIDAAGGFGTEASGDRINLAAPLSNGQQVYVPAVSEPDPRTFGSLGSDELISINQASAPELERLPGIGPVLAKRIVEYREQHGPFQSLDALLEVEGIGPSKLEDLRGYVQVP